MDVKVKHRQLAPTVGRISDDHQANSMGSPNHDDALDKGTTLTFMSWTCVADGSGGFTNYLDDHGHGHREAGRLPPSTYLPPPLMVMVTVKLEDKDREVELARCRIRNQKRAE